MVPLTSEQQKILMDNQKIIHAFMRNHGISAKDYRYEDIFQELMMTAAEMIHLYDPSKCKPSTWIHGSAKIGFFRYFRNQKKTRELILDPEYLQEVVEATEIRTNDNPDLDSAMSRLKEENPVGYESIVLQLEGIDQTTIGQALAKYRQFQAPGPLSKGRVSQIQIGAKKRLRELLTDCQ